MWEKVRRYGREGGDVDEGRDVGEREESWEREQVWEEGDVGVSVEERELWERWEILKRMRRHGSEEGDVGRREQV